MSLGWVYGEDGNRRCPRSPGASRLYMWQWCGWGSDPPRLRTQPQPLARVAQAEQDSSPAPWRHPQPAWARHNGKAGLAKRPRRRQPRLGRDKRGTKVEGGCENRRLAREKQSIPCVALRWKKETMQPIQPTTPWKLYRVQVFATLCIAYASTGRDVRLRMQASGDPPLRLPTSSCSTPVWWCPRRPRLR